MNGRLYVTSENNAYTTPTKLEISDAQDCANLAILIKTCSHDGQDNPYTLYLKDLLHPAAPIIMADREDIKNKLHHHHEERKKDVVLKLTVLAPNRQAAPEQITACNLETGGMLGFLGYRGTCLQLQSRFFWDQNNAQRPDYFLWYMLDKITAFSFFRDLELGQSTQESENAIDYLLIFAFAHQLQAAVRQGIFRTYRLRSSNDPYLRGNVDVTRHLRVNLPFTGRIACSAVEYDCSNSLTQLIRHTLEYIKSQRRYAEISTALQHNTSYMGAVRQIKEVTVSDYRPQKRQAIMQASLRPIAHPYFSAYRDLQHLCRMILTHRNANYSGGKQGVWGLLFTGWWLWEEYLAAVLKPLALTHADSGRKLHGIKDAEGWDRYPDFYAADGDDTVILDAKYKAADHRTAEWHYQLAEQNDLEQMLTYMCSDNLKARQSCRAAMLYPSIEDGTDSTTKICASLHPWGHSLNARLHLIRMPIPRRAGSYSEFKKRMLNAEESLLSIITPWLHPTSRNTHGSALTATGINSSGYATIRSASLNADCSIMRIATEAGMRIVQELFVPALEKYIPDLCRMLGLIENCGNDFGTICDQLRAIDEEKMDFIFPKDTSEAEKDHFYDEAHKVTDMLNTFAENPQVMMKVNIAVLQEQVTEQLRENR